MADGKDNMPLASGQKVLLLWGSATPPENVTDIVSELQKVVTETGAVQLEHKERLLLSSHNASSFDAIQSGVLPPACIVHSEEILGELIRILKPGGQLLVREAVGNSDKIRSADKLVSALKLSGFVNVSSAKPIDFSLAESNDIKTALGVTTDATLVEVTSQKPNYELGASTQLKISFAKKTEAPKVDAKTAAVWTLSANDMGDDDIDLVDEEELLDEDDLKKPDPASLRAECGPGSERKKACKNCTCGLADELDAGKTPKQKTPAAASACGSCYLGDAFRCASCPYLGMPAYKPGEKISLSNRQLKADS